MPKNEIVSYRNQSPEKDELNFNASGDKLVALQEFITNSERKRQIKNADKSLSKSELKLASIEAHMSGKKTEMLRRHLLESHMQKVNKMSIIGDEFALREAVDKRLGVNGRDGLVSMKSYTKAVQSYFEDFDLPTTGRNVLHEAAAHGHMFLVRVLCRDYRADTEKRTTLGGVTALHLAVANGHRPVCFCLIQQGAFISALDYLDNTPMHYVNKISVAKLLISKGASTIVKNRAGRTPVRQYLFSTPLIEQDPKVIAFLNQCEYDEGKAVLSADLSILHEQSEGLVLSITAPPTAAIEASKTMNSPRSKGKLPKGFYGRIVGDTSPENSPRESVGASSSKASKSYVRRITAAGSHQNFGKSNAGRPKTMLITVGSDSVSAPAPIRPK